MNVKKAAILILFCAVALPTAAGAQTADRRVIGTNWSLKPPKQVNPEVQGPSVPPPPRVRKPKAVVARARPEPKRKIDNSSIVSLAKAKQRR